MNHAKKLFDAINDRGDRRAGRSHQVRRHSVSQSKGEEEFLAKIMRSRTKWGTPIEK